MDKVHADLGPNRLTFHSRGEDNHGRYALVEWDMAAPPAPGPPPHRHLDADEGCYVLAGRLHTEVAGAARVLAPGDFLLVPRGTWHALANAGPDRARFLVILSPPGFDGYWAEMAARLAGPGTPPRPDEIAELQARFQMDAGGAARRFE
jgi:quercetin dioxygenase-like cupin family protein